VPAALSEWAMPAESTPNTANFSIARTTMAMPGGRASSPHPPPNSLGRENGRRLNLGIVNDGVQPPTRRAAQQVCCSEAAGLIEPFLGLTVRRKGQFYTTGDGGKPDDSFVLRCGSCMRRNAPCRDPSEAPKPFCLSSAKKMPSAMLRSPSCGPKSQAGTAGQDAPCASWRMSPDGAQYRSSRAVPGPAQRQR
jgi:hypothetical protein